LNRGTSKNSPFQPPRNFGVQEGRIVLAQLFPAGSYEVKP
jgi:hypothetical protein